MHERPSAVQFAHIFIYKYTTNDGQILKFGAGFPEGRPTVIERGRERERKRKRERERDRDRERQRERERVSERELGPCPSSRIVIGS